MLKKNKLIINNFTHLTVNKSLNQKVKQEKYKIQFIKNYLKLFRLFIIAIFTILCFNIRNYKYNKLKLKIGNYNRFFQINCNLNQELNLKLEICDIKNQAKTDFQMREINDYYIKNINLNNI